MEQTLPDLHPNPGWTDTNGQPTDMVGKHCILELYDCDKNRLDDEAFLRTAITTAAKRAGATLLNLITHRFEPQGVTGLALLAESHSVSIEAESKGVPGLVRPGRDVGIVGALIAYRPLYDARAELALEHGRRHGEREKLEHRSSATESQPERPP